MLMFPDVQHSLTQVQDQVQVVLGEQRSAALQGHREGLTPAYDQTLLVDLPGSVSQVVLATSQVDANSGAWEEQRSEVSLLPGRTGVRSGPTSEAVHPRSVLTAFTLSAHQPVLFIQLTASTSLTHTHTPTDSLHLA